MAEGVFFTSPKGLPRGRHNIARDVIEAVQRERLMIAATELLAGVGYRQFGIREICKRATVSQSGFYAHYDNKDACIFAAYQRFVDVLSASLTVATPGLAAGDPIATYVQTYVGTLQRDLVTARAFQVEMETLGYRARHARRQALHALATTLSKQLNDHGVVMDDRAALNTIYAVRQLLSDAIDEDERPNLDQVTEETVAWTKHITLGFSASFRER